MSSQRSQAKPARAVALVCGLALVAGLGQVTPATAVPVEGCPEQDIVPVEELRRGMLGTGLTVSSGREVEGFQAEVLGILPDAIAPGRDMIVVETSSPTIDRVKGVWFGMSGSPVYLQGRLIGAVSFGLAFGPSPIVGLTPAEDMVKVLGYPSGTTGTASRTPESLAPSRIAIPARMQRRIASHTGLSEEQIDRGFRRLRVPFAVSGVSSRGLERIARVINEERLPLIPFSGTSATTNQAGSDPLNPGDSFAAALSYGDITSAGIGTTTMVCGGRALAFGHPFFFEGRSLFGANHADTLAIVGDDVFGPYKLATVAELVGTVDQDRLAAIRADLTGTPTLIPVTSTVSAPNTGVSRDGVTDIVASRFVPFLTFIHLFTNIDSVFDQIGDGSSSLSWSITGTRENGDPWELSRSNLYTSEFDISIDSSFEILTNLFTLLENQFEDIEFTGVDIDATVEEEIKLYNIKKVLVSLNGRDFLERRRVRVRPGDTIGLRVTLLPHQESTERIVDLSVVVPSKGRFSDATVSVTGGSSGELGFFECFFFGEECASDQKVESFDDLLEVLANAPHNNDLLASLRGPRGRVKAQDVEVLDQVVTGQKLIFLRIIR